MKILLYNTGEIKYFADGYKIDGILQPLGLIQEGVYHLDYILTEKPTFDEVTQYVTDGFETDLQANEYKQVWTIHDKPVEQIVIETNNWQHQDKNIRILVPNLLAAEYSGIYALWQMRKLPIELLENDMSYLYCAEIEESFRPVVNGLLAQNLIQVSNLQDLINSYE